MKCPTSILMLALVLLCLQTASAGDINVTDADAIINITPSTPSDDALDSTDAPAQEKFNGVFVHRADATQNFAPSTPSDDALDSAPKITSCDSDGTEKNQFVPGKNVSVRGEDLKPNTNYSIWIQNDPVGEGYTLNASEDPSSSQENVTTDATGSFGPIVIRSIPANEPATYREYDIVVNKRDDGANTSIYNFASDGIDSAVMVGFVTHGLCSDVDCNCIVNIMDVRLLMNHVADPDRYPISEWVGDIDGDGVIDDDDVRLLLAHVFDPAGYPLNCTC